jgi:endonuclease/exonuclease/phosphatase family metal-dependent hydrolase
LKAVGPRVGARFLLLPATPLLAVWLAAAQASEAPLLVPSNFTFTVASANLPGGSQKYQEPQMRILQALRPDIVAMQEFNATNNTPGALRALVDAAFGTNYFYYRESSTNGSYSIPCGIVSRFPIVAAGSWDDVMLSDRGFAWAQIRLPGGQDLYVVSVHLKYDVAGTRAIEATNLLGLIQTNFPAGAWVILAGDLNAETINERAMVAFRSFFSDEAVPADGAGDPDTNGPRSQRYDYVLPSFSFTNHQAPLQLAGQVFSNGLVFDTRVFATLDALPPAQTDDSAACQHMAVVKAFQADVMLTNWLVVPCPTLTVLSNGWLCWTSQSNLVYTVQTSTHLDTPTGWATAGVATSSTTRFVFCPTNAAAGQRFYRVVCP